MKERQAAGPAAVLLAGAVDPRPQAVEDEVLDPEDDHHQTVDLALAHGPETDAAFADLGFRKEGRFWVREDLDLLFEAPAPAGLPGETAPRTMVEIDGLVVVILGIEDLILDRLRAWIHGTSEEDGRWARRLALLHADRLDWGYLREKTAPVPAEARALGALEREANEGEA